MFSIMQYVYFTQYANVLKSYNNQRSYTETKRLTTKTCSIQYCAQDSVSHNTMLLVDDPNKVWKYYQFS